ncbi:MAG: phage holin family protein [Acidobacteriota bacterium]
MQTRRELDRRPEATLPRESFGELLSQLANNSAALVRDEIELARQEMSEKVSVLRSGILIVAVGSLIGLVAILTLTAAAVIGLAQYVGPGYAALIIGGTLALIGGITALAGLGQIKRTSLKPTQTIETLEEDKEWLKELT